MVSQMDGFKNKKGYNFEDSYAESNVIFAWHDETVGDQFCPIIRALVKENL